MKAKLVILALTIGSLILIFWQIKENESLPIPKGNYIELHKTETSVFSKDKLREPFKKENLTGKPEWNMVDATSILAFNPVTSKIYFERNADEKRSIASITKLMAVLVALDVYDLNDVITVSKKIANPDRSLNLEVGDKIKVSELIEAMLVASKNDAAELLAQEYKDGYKGFVGLMNKKAEFLGMSNSHFSNTSGYTDKDNYSTARDLKILALAIISSDTVRDLVAQRSGIFQHEREGRVISQTLYPTNELFGTVGNVKGLKTGYTVKSGPSFIGYFVSSSEDQVITILLNSSDRFQETRQLLNLIQENFKY